MPTYPDTAGTDPNTPGTWPDTAGTWPDTSGTWPGSSSGFDPVSLFADSEAGFLFDLSDASTVFQERSSPSTPSGNGDPIGTLLDLSGNDNHLVPDEGDVRRPTYTVDGSSAYADFPGDNAQHLQGFFTLDQIVTYVISVQIETTDVDMWWMDGAVNSSVTAYFTSGPSQQFYAGSNIIGSGQSFSFGSPFVFTARASGATSRVAVNSNAYSTGDAGANNANGVTFGTTGNIDGAVPMRLYRAIGIGRDLTDDEIASARQWCATAAGVVL